MAGDSTGVCDVEWQAIPAANRGSWSQDSQDMDNMPDFGDHVDDQIFSQILEMDEDQSDRDFSAPLVFGFFEQAHETFEKMQDALSANDLSTLSGLGHFLKGSAATLGFNKIRDSCQVIQQYGHKLNVDGTSEPDEKVCLKKISEALKTAEVDTTELEKIMNGFFKKPE